MGSTPTYWKGNVAVGIVDAGRSYRRRAPSISPRLNGIRGLSSRRTENPIQHRRVTKRPKNMCFPTEAKVAISVGSEVSNHLRLPMPDWFGVRKLPQ